MSFDVYGNCGQTTNCGAFLSNAGDWFLSDTAFGSDAVFTDSNGSWEKATYTVAGSYMQLNFEDWSGSAYKGPNSFYPRDVVLTDNSIGAPVGTLTVSPAVPEPSTWAMTLIGFAGLGFAGYRRANTGSSATVATA